MSLQEQLELLVNSAVQKKEDEIKKLKEDNDKLREEVEKLRQAQNDPQVTPRFGDVKSKAENLKKAIEDFLENPNSSRSYFPRSVFPSVSIPNSNVDVNKPSTSSRADEPLVNGAKFNPNRSNFSSNQEEFTSRQVTDEQLINQANPTDQYHHYHSSSHSSHGPTTLPTAFLGNNPNSQKRFHSGYNANGANNNNRNNRNNNNNSNKCTIFVSWPGTVSKEQLHELFESSGIDVADIRYTAPKQFAHVDLKSQLALDKAMLLNGETKNEKQGALRVEVGKPRSSNTNNPTENGQRPQNLNKNYNRQNNKNPGYNPNLPQKPKYGNNPNYTNYNNNNNGGYSFVPPPEEKESSNSNWGTVEPSKTET